ncbi:hypothetical protein VY88_07355 [Azospirillum thiophilum]|uniref:Uncharacterized protein n=1 Tax=Azospirillum thiophilum TaxID=528244 RepID=A0AAC8VW57_9PROT|nr:hypothetical protein [Azospirillum thiophilum]ALG70427.1 hypothetical protein AL072_05350 [Azospirillum thiophilum]KJR65894.1 hypothetical protein VY88_07355 [Azospirillum thiophilum]
MDTDKPKADKPKNEGEGNRTADAQYRRGVADHVKNHDVQGDAARAREAVDGPEGEELRKAEEAGKSHAKGEDPQLKR